MTLGSELISSEQVALMELVKNAFDADARFVLIRLTGELDQARAVSPDGGTLEVLDDGTGMDESTISTTWLEPATPNRRRDRLTPSGRRILGEKGVGRFAAAKLGSKLELVSKREGSKEVILTVDWSAFEDDEAYLADIPVHWETRRATEFRSGGPVAARWHRALQVHGEGPSHEADSGPRTAHGTLLRISELRTPWTTAMVDEVRRSLSRLVSPFLEQDDVTADFEIILELPEQFGIASGPIRPPEELRSPHYELNAQVDRAGNARGTLTTRNGTEEIEKRLVNAMGEHPPRCGPFDIHLRVWDRDVESLRAVAGEEGSVQSVRASLDAAAGVNVYRDSFRVLPYGERGDDWLGLDLRRVQSPTRRLSNNQIVGYVLISRDANPELADQTNREGIIESPAHEDLRHAVMQLLGILENKRYTERRREREPRGGLLERIDLGELRSAIAQAIPTDTRIASMVTDLQQEVDERLQQVGEVLSRYHRLATLGQLIDRVVHELGQPIVAIRQAATLGLEAVARARGQETDTGCDELAGTVEKHLTTIERQGRTINEVVRRIAPFGGRRRGRPQEFEVETAIRDAVELLHEEVRSVGARIELPDGSTHVTVDGTELQEIIVNLLTNSLYWLRRVGKDERAIRFSVERNADESLSITVEDSGPGIPESDRDLIFEPYFTTKEGGVGLGLAIAGEIVSDYYGGQLELLPPGELGGARFRATLRRRVG